VEKGGKMNSSVHHAEAVKKYTLSAPAERQRSELSSFVPKILTVSNESLPLEEMLQPMLFQRTNVDSVEKAIDALVHGSFDVIVNGSYRVRPVLIFFPKSGNSGRTPQ
jgi:hypothetical protein